MKYTVKQHGFIGAHCDCVVFSFFSILEFILCAECKLILSSLCIYICTFCPVAQLIIEHVFSMATTSETGIKHKALPIQEKLEIINKVGYYFRLLLDKKGIAVDFGVSVSRVNTEL